MTAVSDAQKLSYISGNFHPFLSLDTLDFPSFSVRASLYIKRRMYLFYSLLSTLLADMQTNPLWQGY